MRLPLTMPRWIAGPILWPLTERLRGRDTMRRVEQLTHSQNWPAKHLRDLQQHKLHRVLRSAARHCPFYAQRFRDAGLDVDDPQLSLADLKRLPPITRADIREHHAAMTWHECPGGARRYQTGGSTGEPLQFYIDRFRASADAAARWRARGYWGVRPGDPEILLWGAPFELTRNDRLRRWRDGLLNQYLLNAFDMTAANMDDYLAHIRSLRPACLYGYPSSLALLARHAASRGMQPGNLGSDRLRAVFVTGEVLLEQDREIIAAMFGKPVVVEYGSRDGGFTAMACPSGQLHIADENLIIELLDPAGQQVAPGEIGEITLTHLDAFAMPLVRYRIGDLARLADPGTSCPCGRAHAVLTEVHGRVTDHIVCRQGSTVRRMHALSLIYVLREAEGLAQFRVTQPSMDRLDVEVVPDARFTTRQEQLVENRLRQRMGDNVTIRIHRRDHIPPTASGKHACVVSKVVENDE